MLELRLLDDNDMAMVKDWLNKEHVKRWYEIPDMGITLQDWMNEISQHESAFRWITYHIVLMHGHPIGLCQYYKCEDSADEDFAALPLAGSYGIDYLIGEESYLRKGLGKGIITMLVNKIFSFSDAQRVTADIDKNNKASRKALISCGFSLVDCSDCRYVIHRAK